ncbi:hypothetical protein CA85_38430 [Allorhodopirellula solitaria]|uniref:Uncharacterized protein n=1 Tax=Allorhodopirellula solitaria TaxID=2527987 RepID=A0A5C5XP61_9BACT|nr:hypothetical protein CA85_38430 [Allorhodopirellula solitaria]
MSTAGAVAAGLSCAAAGAADGRVRRRHRRDSREHGKTTCPFHTTLDFSRPCQGRGITSPKTWVHPTESCAEHSGRIFEAWLSYPMIVQKCVPDEQTLARDRQHHWRTAFAGKRWRPRYPLPSQHLCRARLRFSRQCQSNIDNHIPQINPSIREPCLENLGRTLPSDEPKLGRGGSISVDVVHSEGLLIIVAENEASFTACVVT